MKSELYWPNSAQSIIIICLTDVIPFKFLWALQFHSFHFTWSFETIWTLRNILQQQLAAIKFLNCRRLPVSKRSTQPKGSMPILTLQSSIQFNMEIRIPILHATNQINSIVIIFNNNNSNNNSKKVPRRDNYTNAEELLGQLIER